MRIACVGGGPAGLYFAISMKLRDPAHDVHVFERNRAGDTFGWGVVFSDQTVDNLMANDPESGRIIADAFSHWDDIEVAIGGETVRASGHGFIGIGRKRLLRILHDRAEALGVALHFEHEASDDLADYAEYDLVIAADGLNSRFRTRYAGHFGVDIDVRRNKFIWLGTHKTFDAFTFAFEQTEAGWIWAHAYRFADDLSTFIVECAPDTWQKLGFADMDQPEAIALCETIFARHLYGHKLMTNAAHLRGSAAWINFPRVLCERWAYDKLILVGDAAHTAHFSIGSGTKLALEDAIKLAEVLNRPGLSRDQGLIEYQAERTVEVLKLQNSARNSTEWFETLDRYLGFAPIQFAYSLLARCVSSTRISACATRPGWPRSSAGSPAARAPRWRRCSCPTGCVTWHSPTASSSHRWRPIRQRTAPRTISISSTTAPGRRVVPASSTPRCPASAPLAASPQAAPACTRPSTSRAGAASSISSTPTRRRRSASSSAMPAPRVRPGSVGRVMTSRSTPACASRSRCSPRCAPPGRPSARCRCASRPMTGPATTA